MKVNLYYPLFVLYIFFSPIYSSYFTECDVKVEVLELIRPPIITYQEKIEFLFVKMKIKIISENSCHGNHSNEILLENVPYSIFKFIDKGSKLLVHYSYSNFDPYPGENDFEIILWKFKSTIE